MREEEFIEIVEKAQKEASKNFGAYKRKLGLFALLGYFIIFLVLFLLILLVGGTFWAAFAGSGLLLLLIKKKIIIGIVMSIWVFLKALWIKVDPPQGYVLERARFPKLFEEIDTLSQKLKALPINRVILTDELNAGVVQHPKFGMIGGQENILYLGLQLLLLLSPEEFRSVLAHEFGHLSANHSRFSTWIYRVRSKWQYIMQALEQESSFGASMMQKFFNWYAPRFDAYSFVLARHNEYEADQIAMDLTSPQVASSALSNLYTQASYIDEIFWGKHYKKAEVLPRPPETTYEDLKKFLDTSPIREVEFNTRLQEELKRDTHYADTHPSLRDRLDAMGSLPLKPAGRSISAAEKWFGEYYIEVLKYFGRQWKDANHTMWWDRHRYMQESKVKMEAYGSKGVEQLTNEEFLEYATWIYEFEEGSSALPVLQAYLKRDPENSHAHYLIGKILYESKNEDAIEYFRVALMSFYYSDEVSQLGFSLLKKLGKDKEADLWWEDVKKAYKIHEKALHERESISINDAYRKPDGIDILLDEIREKLKDRKHIKSVWISQKVLKHHTEMPLYIIVIETKGFLWDHDDFLAEIAEEVASERELIYIGFKGETEMVAKHIKPYAIQII